LFINFTVKIKDTVVTNLANFTIKFACKSPVFGKPWSGWHEYTEVINIDLNETVYLYKICYTFSLISAVLKFQFERINMLDL
jgi:hypothetical protein